MLREHRKTQSGFTLIELVVTVAILGIVMAALVGVVFGYLRVSNETSTRLTESTDQQFVSAYWQQDVSSLGLRSTPDGGVVPTAQSVWLNNAPGCSPTSGSPVVTFAWNDYKDAPNVDAMTSWTGAKENRATYYTKLVSNSNGTNQKQLWRKRCGDVSSDIVVARHLVADQDPPVNCFDRDGAETACSGSAPFPATVTITLSVQDKSEAVHSNTGYDNLKLTGHRRQG